MKDTQKYADAQGERSCPWAQTLDTQQPDAGGGTTHDIASGQNLFLREVFSKTTAITTTELSGSSQEMITLISLEVKIRKKMLGSILASN